MKALIEWAASIGVIVLFLLVMSDGEWFPWVNLGAIGSLIAIVCWHERREESA